MESSQVDPGTSTHATTDRSDMETYDVIVLGTGVSGLTAAYEILKQDKSVSVCVIEAKGRVGGRTFSTTMKVKDGRTETFDLGGQWVGTAQLEIMEVLQELGLETYPQYITGRKYMLLGDNRVRSYTSTIPNLGSWWGLIQLQMFIWKVEKLVKKCPTVDPCRHPDLKKLEGETVSSFARKSISNQAALDAITAAVKVIYGAEPDRISVIHFLADASAAGGLEHLLEATPGSAQELKVKGGTQQISELLADRVGREKIHMDQPVLNIHQGPDDVTVTTGDGHRYRGKYVISSLPPNQLVQVTLEPPLSPERQEILRNTPIGHLIKFLVTYPEAFWRQQGDSGEVVTNGGPSPTPDCDKGPVCLVYDATSYQGSPALVGFIGGKDSLQWQRKSQPEREKAVIDSLTVFFGSKTQNYIQYLDKVWAEEPYTGGCPVCFATPGLMSSYSQIRLPHGRVHFCGTELATRWNGFMSGAVQTGRNAAVEVLHRLRPDCLAVTEVKKD